MVAFTVIYSSAAISSHHVACVFRSCSRLQNFYDLQKFTVATVAKATLFSDSVIKNNSHIQVTTR